MSFLYGWHTDLVPPGIEQFRTPWSDGTPGISQRPIPPGGSFSYEWTATQYGAYWYHSHAFGQIFDGLYGPIVISPDANQQTPFGLITNDSTSLAAIQDAVDNVQPLILSDWQRYTSEEQYAIVVASGITDLCMDSLLFNGQGQVNCWTQAEINAATTPGQAGALAAANETSLTAKGYVMVLV